MGAVTGDVNILLSRFAQCKASIKSQSERAVLVNITGNTATVDIITYCPTNISLDEE